MKKLHVRKGGFTLIELMIVVAIIGILAAIAIPNFLRFQLKAKTSEGKTNLAAIRTAEQSYYSEYGRYVSSAGAGPRLTAVGQREDRLRRRRPASRRSAGRPRARCTSATRSAPTRSAPASSRRRRPTSTRTTRDQTWAYQRLGAASAQMPIAAGSGHACTDCATMVDTTRSGRATAATARASSRSDLGRRTEVEGRLWPALHRFSPASSSTTPHSRSSRTMRSAKRSRNRGGFTLIELMIVVGLIGVLAAIAIPNFLTLSGAQPPQRGLHQRRRHRARVHGLPRRQGQVPRHADDVSARAEPARSARTRPRRAGHDQAALGRRRPRRSSASSAGGPRATSSTPTTSSPTCGGGLHR